MRKDWTTFLIALRPKQWIKNLLVIAAPVASGQLLEFGTQALLALCSFIFASSFGYVINDWVDRDLDKNHESKKLRPFASGQLDRVDLIILIALCLVGSLLPLAFLTPNFSLVLGIYLCVTISYSFGIKNVPVLEMILLASGFLVRALAGSVVVQEPPTGWFITCIFFGALFLVSSKRIAETRKSQSIPKRKVLSEYPDDFLPAVSTLSIGITILTYSLWVFEVHSDSAFAVFSIIPFTFTMLMYLYSCDRGNAETPEHLLFSNRFLVSSMLVTIMLLLLVFYT